MSGIIYQHIYKHLRSVDVWMKYVVSTVPWKMNIGEEMEGQHANPSRTTALYDNVLAFFSHPRHQSLAVFRGEMRHVPL
jgi:hypothetical protein